MNTLSHECVLSMIKYKLLFPALIVLLVCISSCKKKTSPEELKFENKVSIAPENKTLKLSELFKDFKIIPLKGPLLTFVNDLVPLDSLWVIKGKSAQSSLHLYTSEGVYKKSILAEGRGVNEAFNIQSVKNNGDDKIEILANFATKLLVYSLSKDQIITQANLPKELIDSDDFIQFDSIRYIIYKHAKSYNNDGYKINIFNSITSKIEKQYFPLTSNDEFIAFSQTRNFYRYKDKILFYEVFAPGIYQIHPDSLSLYISFDKGKFNFPPSLLKKEYNDFNDFITTCEKSSYIWAHIDPCESNKYILSQYTFENVVYLNVIDKETMVSHSYTHIYDDLITNEILPIEEGMRYITAKDNCQFFTLESYKFSEIIENKKDANTYEEYSKKYTRPCDIANKLTEDDNTLIVQFFE